MRGVTVDLRYGFRRHGLLRMPRFAMRMNVKFLIMATQSRGHGTQCTDYSSFILLPLSRKMATTKEGAGPWSSPLL